MRVATATIIVSTTAIANAFAPISSNARLNAPMFMESNTDTEIASFDPLNLSSDVSHEFDIKPAMASLVAMAALAPAANAAGPDWGIFEGRTGSLLHPVIMGGTFLFSLSTALLGFQYRRQRTMGGEISALKKTLPNLGDASTLSAAIAQAEEGEDSALASQLKAALPIQAEIDALTDERKGYSSKKVKDTHFSQGATLAFIGTAFAIEGPLNTYARAGKLFPGPHLYAGAGLVVLWAAAAACVPAMQKGNDTARSIHIGANVSGIGLFAWQITTGWPILQKVVQFTHWP